ncbi:DUF881 domain-containing protein [Ectobacillus antri]|uniref:DUF881 domain-containing protein n=1 Tax=Ectobacillus antri TaxID=2486280 RepID=A0ABT6H199_9BACI|nr:DUF881 domain-containing protein [Ectobacillus antri]MDG4655838.1 DUF881 domain-containing protein [Ectobacillus antri]MDG5752513.1 DUF881 domain-containing protein [Ectobacillus antri]
MKIKGYYALLSLVCLVLGFMIAYSYSLTAKREPQKQRDKQWDREYELRSSLIRQEKANATLEKKVVNLQKKVRAEEQKLGDQQKQFSDAVKEVEELRMYLGRVKVKGAGIELILADATKIPGDKNVNNYLVHDGHIQMVLNELYASGANAIAINGQRLTAHSFVTCIGPVVNVNGTEHPAPFIITALGNSDVLSKALNIKGGVIDRLLRDNISVKLQTKSDLTFERYYEK